jgi:hypothetical protein
MVQVLIGRQGPNLVVGLIAGRPWQSKRVSSFLGEVLSFYLEDDHMKGMLADSVWQGRGFSRNAMTIASRTAFAQVFTNGCPLSRPLRCAT